MQGKVTALWRYPVKSFQGESLGSAEVGPTGITGDRRYGVRSVESGKVLSAKTEAALLEGSARTEGAEVVLTFPGSSDVPAEDPSVNGLLSGWLGRPVELAAAGAEGPTQAAYEMAIDPSGSFDLAETPGPASSIVAIPMMPDRFVDLAHLHILTEGSLATCRDSAPELDWDVRRFRPNILTNTSGGNGGGLAAGPTASPDGLGEGEFPEDAWVGGNIRIGADALIAVDLRAIRCAVPLRPQPGLPRSREIHGVLSRTHEYHLGVYCRVVEPGAVSLGDPVTVA